MTNTQEKIMCIMLGLVVYLVIHSWFPREVLQNVVSCVS